MPISVDTIRGLTSKYVVFDSQREALDKAGVGHHIANFFGSKAAKSVNRETMNAIKNAVLSESRYFGIRERAAQMLSGLDNGSCVDLKKIKSVISQLDAISTPAMQKKQLSERFAMHLAMRELPRGWSEHTAEITSYLNAKMNEFIRAAGGNAGNINPSLVIDDFCRTLSVVSDACGGDGRVVNFAAKLLARRPDALDTPEKARNLMNELAPVLEELRALDARNPGTGIIDRGIGIMTDMLKVVKPGVMTALHAAAERLDSTGVRSIGENGRDIASDIHLSLKNLFAAVSEGGIQYPQGGALDDADGILSALKFVYGDFASSLGKDARSELLEKLTSEAGNNLRLFYEDVGGRDAINNIKIYDTMVESLQRSLGLPAERIDVENLRGDFSKIPMKVLGDFPIETMFIGTAGQNGDMMVASRRTHMMMLQNGEERPVDPNTYLRNHMNAQGKTRMNEEFSRSMRSFASGATTLFEKSIGGNVSVLLPNGVRLPNDFAAARDEVSRYVAGKSDATFEGLDAVARNKAWLLMSLISQGTGKIALEAASGAYAADGERPVYKLGEDGSSTFTVSETENGDWVVRNESSGSLNEIDFTGQEQMVTGTGSRLDTLTEISVPKSEIDRIAALPSSDFTGTSAVTLDADVSVVAVHTLTRPSDEVLSRHEISQMPVKMNMTVSEANLFNAVVSYETTILGKATDVLSVLKDDRSPANRLLSYPALVSDKEVYRQGKELMADFDRVFGEELAKDMKLAEDTAYRYLALSANHRKTLERFVFEELNALVESGGKLPSIEEFRQNLKSADSYLDFARWGFGSATEALSVLAMPVEFRRSTIAALKAFQCSTELSLFSRVVAHREKILSLYSENRLTAASVYLEIMGKELPDRMTEQPGLLRDCVYNENTDLMNKYIATYHKEIDENDVSTEIKVMHAVSLMAQYDVSVEEAFLAQFGDDFELDIGRDKRFNPFRPMVCQSIGGDVSSAIEGLAVDINRMNYGYSRDGHKARIEPGSVFTFHFPDGTDTSVSSMPVGMNDEQLGKYRSGKPSSLTDQVAGCVRKMCGPGREEQAAALILALAQGALEPLLTMPTKFGKATEHSQVRIELNRHENGDVEVRYSNPDNCPVEFDWTLTVSRNGVQKAGEVHMRRAESFVDMDGNVVR